MRPNVSFSRLCSRRHEARAAVRRSTSCEMDFRLRRCEMIISVCPSMASWLSNEWRLVLSASSDSSAWRMLISTSWIVDETAAEMSRDLAMLDLSDFIHASSDWASPSRRFTVSRVAQVSWWCKRASV